MLFNSSVHISRHPVRLVDKNCDVSVITLLVCDILIFVDLKKIILALLQTFTKTAECQASWNQHSAHAATCSTPVFMRHEHMERICSTFAPLKVGIKTWKISQVKWLSIPLLQPWILYSDRKYQYNEVSISIRTLATVIDKYRYRYFPLHENFEKI